MLFRSDVVNAKIATDTDSGMLGDLISLNGAFSLPDTTPLIGLPVRVESKNASTDWHPIFSGLTGTDGSISIKSKFGENTSLRVVSDGTWERLASQSQVKEIKISKLISWSAPSSMRQGVSYSIKGQIQPKSSDQKVKLFINGVKSSETLTDMDGRFTIPLIYDKLGIIGVKLNIDGDSRFAESSSKLTQILVR